MSPGLLGENQWLMAFDKPAGLIVHSDGRTEEPSLAAWIGTNYPVLRGVGGDWVSPQGEHVPLNGLLHRLDRTTSGVVLAAKDEPSFVFFKSEFKARRVSKKYLAWVYGTMPEESGTIVAEIMRSSERPKRWYARETTRSDPRAAITNWTMVQQKENSSLLELCPETGRTHQLRVHLASIGHAIVSDHLYAPDTGSVLGFSRPALHAASIELAMPDGTRTEFEAPLPADFRNAAIA